MQFIGIVIDEETIRDYYGCMKSIPNNRPRWEKVFVFINEHTGKVTKVVPVDEPDIEPTHHEAEVALTDAILDWEIDVER